MSVRIRLARGGAKKRPVHKIVVADKRCRRDGRYIEIVGTYNPVVEPATVKFDEEKVMKWLSVGAKPTDTVKSLLTKEGLIAKFLESKKAE